ncbi:sugar-binding transcriptional regulator [Actinorugispora endophytica]|uniref:Deoxyribonucleoside regulator n=1 Tax=Actinorugispora endophytica TaxID=1605990 RepID=A0A4R6V0P2_9ACTN|nr:sugar-binding transcriptional regulator [Actinorugispora endophytica]TDQ52185.1 deoxyribonucleoside regulator [Actinorugispora endophytica]
MSDPDYESLLYQVASLYYEHDRTQEQIGSQLHFTRWKVGRMLVEAREAGIVRIEVLHPRARVRDLEKALRDRFGLRDAVVVAARSFPDEEELREHVAKAAAEYLSALRPAPRLLGVSWGRTLDLIARDLPHGWAQGVGVVQINGGISRSRRPSTAQDVASRIAHQGSGTVTLLPVPAIVDHETTRQILEGDSTVSRVLGQAADSDVLLFSPGGIGTDSVLVESGHIDAADVARLAEDGAVGDVVGRFIDGRGEVVDPELNGRTLGLPLDALRGAPVSIAVASGTAKHAVCGAVVASRLCNTLITDDRTASWLLDHDASEAR